MKFKLSSGETNDYSPEAIQEIRTAIQDSHKARKPGHTGEPCQDFQAERPQRSMHNNCQNCGTSELVHAVFGHHPNHTTPAWEERQPTRSFGGRTPAGPE